MAEIVPYGGWSRCLRLTDGQVEVLATLEVGPRVIRYGMVGGPNLLVEYPQQMGQRGGDTYRSYGGHRLWIAPEVVGRTNLPDNEPVEAREDGDWSVLVAPVEGSTRLQREIRLRLVRGRVEIVHRIHNRGLYAVELAPWALTVMAAGGVGFFPQEPFVPHAQNVLPVRPLVLWGYTNMADPRFAFGPRLVRLRQTGDRSFQKVGALVTEGWCGYARDGFVFLKSFPCLAGAVYPDMGCNFETFTRHDMLELESLGPMTRVAPGGHVEHPETWLLTRAPVLPAEDAAAMAMLTPLVARLREA